MPRQRPATHWKRGPPSTFRSRPSSWESLHQTILIGQTEYWRDKKEDTNHTEGNIQMLQKSKIVNLETVILMWVLNSVPASTRSLTAFLNFTSHLYSLHLKGRKAAYDRQSTAIRAVMTYRGPYGWKDKGNEQESSSHLEAVWRQLQWNCLPLSAPFLHTLTLLDGEEEEEDRNIWLK